MASMYFGPVAALKHEQLSTAISNAAAALSVDLNCTDHRPELMRAQVLSWQLLFSLGKFVRKGSGGQG